MELKGNFHELIAHIDDPSLLKKMFQQCLELLKGVDMLTDMTPESIQLLEKAIEDSYADESGLSNAEAQKRFKSWLLTES